MKCNASATVKNGWFEQAEKGIAYSYGDSLIEQHF